MSAGESGSVPPEARWWRGGGVWPAVRPYRLNMAGVSLASFLVGAVEALILVSIVRAALALSEGDSRVAFSVFDRSFEPTVTAVLVLVMGLGVLRFALEASAGALTARASSDVLAARRPELFRRYLNASWATQAGVQHGQVLDLLSRHVAQVQAIVLNVAATLSSLLSFLALLASAIVAAPASAVAIMVTAAVLFAVMRPITSLIRRSAQQRVEAGREYSAFVTELLPMTVELRTFGVGGAAATRVEDLTAAEARPARRTTFLSTASGAAYRSMVLVVLAAGLLVVSRANLDVADIGASALILLRGLNYSQVLQSAHHRLADLRPFLENLELEAAKLEAVAVDATAGASIDRLESVTLQRVGYRYSPDRWALEDVDLAIHRGETVGLIGPSGSGKTTLTQLLLRLREPTVGDLLLNDRAAAEWSQESWYRHVAYVPQEPRLFSGTVLENIQFFRADVGAAEVERAARLARIHDDIQSWPSGYDTPVGPRGNSVSGGQRQRIALARALVGRPDLLVLDEPTSALDLRSESLVQETLRDLRHDLTMVIVAHRMSTVNICDRIVVLIDGRVQDVGARADLERDSDFYREALRLSQIS